MASLGTAVRAIIVKDGRCLVMYRNKHGSQYYTLVGGRLNPGEELEQALVREVKEETGLTVTAARLVFIEEHNSPDHNDQYIFICNVAPFDNVAIQDLSEEGMMNRIGINIHEPVWAEAASLDRLAFRTPQLQKAIINGLRNGFPEQPIKL